MDIYRERAHLIAHLAIRYPAVIQHGADPDEPDWPVIYIHTPQGQMSWHLSKADLDLFDHVSAGNGDTPDWPDWARWDGHTTEVKYERLAALTWSLYLAHLGEPA